MSMPSERPTISRRKDRASDRPQRARPLLRRAAAIGHLSAHPAVDPHRGHSASAGGRAGLSASRLPESDTDAEFGAL
jgi:hypothetical protein